MQTSHDFAELIRPLLGKSCWRLYCDLGNSAPAKLAHLSSKDKFALRQCDPYFDYGNVMVELDGGSDDKDLTFTHDFYRDGIGGAPIWALRVTDKSIPALWAEELDAHRYLRHQTFPHCQLFPLEWRMRCGISHNDSFILTAAWAVPDKTLGQYEPRPCMSAVALQFDWMRKTYPSTPVNDLPDWLKPGLLSRLIDQIERVIGRKESKAPPRTGTMFLGMTYPVNDDEAGISYFFQDHLPDGLGWERVACVTESKENLQNE